MTKKEQAGTIEIKKAGVHKITAYPKVPTSKATKWNYKFKGLELIPVK